jgi:uncharacterized membrane protein YgcG
MLPGRATKSLFEDLMGNRVLRSFTACADRLLQAAYAEAVRSATPTREQLLHSGVPPQVVDSMEVPVDVKVLEHNWEAVVLPAAASFSGSALADVVKGMADSTPDLRACVSHYVALFCSLTKAEGRGGQDVLVVPSTAALFSAFWKQVCAHDLVVKRGVFQGDAAQVPFLMHAACSQALVDATFDVILALRRQKDLAEAEGTLGSPATDTGASSTIRAARLAQTVQNHSSTRHTKAPYVPPLPEENGSQVIDAYRHVRTLHDHVVSRVHPEDSASMLSSVTGVSRRHSRPSPVMPPLQEDGWSTTADAGGASALLGLDRTVMPMYEPPRPHGPTAGAPYSAGTPVAQDVPPPGPAPLPPSGTVNGGGGGGSRTGWPSRTGGSSRTARPVFHPHRDVADHAWDLQQTTRTHRGHRNTGSPDPPPREPTNTAGPTRKGYDGRRDRGLPHPPPRTSATASGKDGGPRDQYDGKDDTDSTTSSPVATGRASNRESNTDTGSETSSGTGSGTSSGTSSEGSSSFSASSGTKKSDGAHARDSRRGLEPVAAGARTKPRSGDPAHRTAKASSSDSSESSSGNHRRRHKHDSRRRSRHGRHHGPSGQR